MEDKVGKKKFFAWRLAIRWLLYGVFGVILLFSNPFGIADQTDQATQDVIYRLLAPAYDTDAQDDLVVVLLDATSIRELYEWGVIEANEWPLRYRDHAYLLSRILALRPRSLFVDIYFKQERSTDDSLPLMEARLERALDQNSAQLLFAGGFAGERRTDLQLRLNQLGKPSQDGRLAINGWEGYGVSYPLNDNGYLGTAYRMYEAACIENAPLGGCRGDLLHRDQVEAGDALSVNWGSQPPRQLFSEFQSGVCTSAADSVWKASWNLVLGVLEGLIPDQWVRQDTREECPFHPVIFANHLVTLLKSSDPGDKARLEEAFADKLVLYGVSLEGLHDRIPSPVHGQIPGVFLHAMALDNLMQSGERYIRATDSKAEWLAIGFWFVLALLFAAAHRVVEIRPEWFAECAELHRKSSDCEDAGSWWRGRIAWLAEHPKTVIFFAGSGLVVSVATGFYMVLDYEPINGIGFFGLLAVLSWVRGTESETKLVRRLEKFFTGRSEDELNEDEDAGAGKPSEVLSETTEGRVES